MQSGSAASIPFVVIALEVSVCVVFTSELPTLKVFVRSSTASVTGPVFEMANLCKSTLGTHS